MPPGVSTSDFPVVKETKRPLILILCIVGVLALGVALYCFYTNTKPKTSDKIIFSSGHYRANPIYTIADGTSTPVTVTVNSVEKKALDMVMLADGSTLYSLIESDEPLVSNIYKVGLQGNVTQLTNSPSVKFNLSGEPSGAHVVYEEVSLKNNQEFLTPKLFDITSLDVATKATTRITTGIQPRYLRSGTILVGQMNGVALYQSGVEASVVLPPTTYSLYTVNGDGTKLAAYNVKTHMLDVFDVTTSGTLSYSYSAVSGTQPPTLGFAGTDPVSVQSLVSPKGTVYSIIRYGKKNAEHSVIIPDGRSIQRLLYVLP